MALTPPYNTVQLTATPVNALGEPISDAVPVTFTAVDSIVSVDTAGRVTANFRTEGLSSLTRVIASLRYQNVTLADTATIQVTATAPSSPLATFTLQAAPGYSTQCNLNITAIENCGSVVTIALDSAGDTLRSATKATLVVAYASSHPLLATIDSSGTITELDTGHVTFSTSTWAYGVVMRDSLPYIIDWPQENAVHAVQTITHGATPTLDWSYPAMTIVAGGTIVWSNQFDQKIDIIFDDSTAVSACLPSLLCSLFPPTGSGNVPPFYTDTTYTDPSVYALGAVIRSFPIAGTYHYHSRIFPSTRGVIYVKEPITP
jgi:hypothetical protein